jgi:hypothetical protein
MKKKKTVVRTFRDIPYHVILEILNEYFLINYTKMFVKYVVKEHKAKNTKFEDLVKSFAVKCFFGYFRTDRCRGVFLLFKSIKLKDRVVTENYTYETFFGNYNICFDPLEDKKKRGFCIGCNEIEALKLPEIDSIEMTDDDINITEHFLKLSVWLLPKNTKYMKIVQEINDLLYYDKLDHIPDDITGLDIIFKGFFIDESTGNLSHEIIEKFSKLKKYPTITFDYYLFGGWPMYYFIKHKNTEKEWKINLVDCRIYEVIDFLKEDLEYILRKDNRSFIESNEIIKEASNIMWEIRNKHTKILDKRQKKRDEMKEEIDALKKSIEEIKKELLQMHKIFADNLMKNSKYLEKGSTRTTRKMVVRTQRFLRKHIEISDSYLILSKKREQLTSKCMDLLLKTKDIEKFDPDLDIKFEVKIGKITLKFFNISVKLF